MGEGSSTVFFFPVTLVETLLYLLLLWFNKQFYLCVSRQTNELSNFEAEMYSLLWLVQLMLQTFHISVLFLLQFSSYTLMKTFVMAVTFVIPDSHMPNIDLSLFHVHMQTYIFWTILTVPAGSVKSSLGSWLLLPARPQTGFCCGSNFTSTLYWPSNPTCKPKSVETI